MSASDFQSPKNENPGSTDLPSPKAKSWLPAAVIFLTLLILGATIFLARQQLFQTVKDQIIARDGNVLHAVTLMPLLDAEPGEDPRSTLADPADQLTLMLRTSQLSGVLGARLFTSNGVFVQSFPPNVRESNLSPQVLAALQNLEPVSRFYDHYAMSDLILSTNAALQWDKQTAPLLEIDIPIHAPKSEKLVGIAQYLIEGESIRVEFEQLARSLNIQSAIAFGVTGSILSIAMALAFHRLRRSQLMLEQRSQDLLKANQELVTTAKTNAIGAVTSHLIHELKNPLSGLHHFVSDQIRTAPTDSQEIWSEALSATKRMQSTVQEIISLLHEEQSSLSYKLSLTELAELVRGKLEPQAMSKSVRLDCHVMEDTELDHRAANLVKLILVNLGANAIHASPEGDSVQFRFAKTPSSVEFQVEDHGPGLSTEASQKLFQPHRSTREGGSGIGLAICKQLANHLAAKLEVSQSNARGCVFVLTLPMHSTAEATPTLPG